MMFLLQELPLLKLLHPNLIQRDRFWFDIHKSHVQVFGLDRCVHHFPIQTLETFEYCGQKCGYYVSRVVCP